MFNFDIDIYVKLGVFLAGLGYLFTGLSHIIEASLSVWKERKVQRVTCTYTQ